MHETPAQEVPRGRVYVKCPNCPHAGSVPQGFSTVQCSQCGARVPVGLAKEAARA